MATSGYFKELVKDKKTGKLRDITPQEKSAADRLYNSQSQADEDALARQRALDKMVMTPEAFRKKWGNVQ